MPGRAEAASPGSLETARLPEEEEEGEVVEEAVRGAGGASFRRLPRVWP